MKEKNAMMLKVGSLIDHKRYGTCKVREVMMSCGSLFGIVIRPVTEDGKVLLEYDSGTDIPDFLEGNAKEINPQPE